MNTKRPTLAFFLVPTKPLQSYGQASPHPDTVLVKSREMTDEPNSAMVAGGRRG